MAMTTIVINQPNGLHVRPLAKFVKVVNQFDCDISVWNQTTGQGPAPGRSLLKLLLLAVKPGQLIQIEACGVDAAEAVQALHTLVATDFAG